MLETYEGRKVVIASLVGSWAYNLNTPESDEDWKYFVCPTFEDLYNSRRFTAPQSISPELDVDVHDVRKLPEQLWKSNLNFLGVLFGHKVKYVGSLKWIHWNADSLARMNLPNLYSSTLGMHYQKMGDLLKGTSTTQELVRRFGYDTKQACHAMRCLLVLERIADGMSVREALWFGGNQRQYLIDIKQGAFNLSNFHDLVEIWHVEHREQVSEFFHNTQPVPELNEELNYRVQDFIEDEIVGR